MATLRPDPDLLAAIRRHVGAWHGRGIDEAAIAPERKGRLARATQVTFWPETAQEPAWFTCRLCPEGPRRYRADLYASPGRPPPRHVAAIQRHFAERHAHPNLSPRRIYRQPSSEKRALAVYLPANMDRGAGFICMRCPVGRNRIFVDDPPYGDARRLKQLLRESPDLYHELQRLGPAARAARLEAKDRGIIAQVQQSAVERALRRTRPTMAPPREPSPIEQGIQTLLLERVGQGATATQVIEDLTTMMASDPTAYACQLGEAIPDMEGHLAGPARQFAALLVSLYGRLERSERTLWEMWRRIPPDDRKRARERGRPSGGDALH